MLAYIIAVEPFCGEAEKAATTMHERAYYRNDTYYGVYTITEMFVGNSNKYFVSVIIFNGLKNISI